MIISKMLTCKKCDHQVNLITKIDEDGLAIQKGWSVLRDHIDYQHPEYARQLNQWLNDGSTHHLPYDTVAAEVDRAA